MSYDTTPDAPELVPIECEAYDDDAELEIDYEGHPTVENHQELVTAGHVYTEIRAMNRRDAEAHNFRIIEEDDVLWDEEFADLDAGDEWRLDELR